MKVLRVGEKELFGMFVIDLLYNGFIFFWKKIILIFCCVYNKNLIKKLFNVSNVWILFLFIEICFFCDDIENVEVEDYLLFFGGFCKFCKVWLML